jgi:hypothetical protein
MKGSTRRCVKRQKKSVSSNHFGPVPGAAVGFVAVNDVELTSYTAKGIQRAALPDLLVRALAIGDDPPPEGMVLHIAEQLNAVHDLVATEHKAIGTLLFAWSVQLQIAAELFRRTRAGQVAS